MTREKPVIEKAKVDLKNYISADQGNSGKIPGLICGLYQLLKAENGRKQSDCVWGGFELLLK